jgi:AcrR family transcriptional regulator
MTPRRYEMRARSETVAETRRRIVEATNALLREGWYDEISLKDIASEAGVAPQTIVDHFGSKRTRVIESHGLSEREFTPRACRESP